MPVRPTENKTSLTFEYFSDAGNFHATAHLGALETKPNLSCSFDSFTFTTAPSIS